MNARDLPSLVVILGLVFSGVLLLQPASSGSVVLLFLGLLGTVLAFSIWVRGHTARSRSVLLIGAAILFAATLWMEYLLTPLEAQLRWLLSIALAWMVAPFGALAMASIADRLRRGLRG